MIENTAGWRYVQSADTVADYPTVSEHNAGKFQDLKTNVDGKAPVSHTHTQSQVTGLDAALAGKAPVSHTHSTSQVTGLDAALAGKAPLSTLDTRVPAGLALRLDTTVGTRVFAGNTMIHGDTGWRAIVEWNLGGEIITGAVPAGIVGKFNPSGAASGGLYLRRIMNQVYGYFVGDTITNTNNFSFLTPLGYRANASSFKTVARSAASFTPPDDQKCVLFIGSSTYLIGLREGMPAGGNAYPEAGTQWNYLSDQVWPDATSTYTPKNTTILP